MIIRARSGLGPAACTILAVLSGSATAAPQSAAPIDWQPCAPLVEAADPAAECAVVQMPWFHEAPGDLRIGIMVARIRGNGDPAQPRRQIWFLDGGPGDSGIASLKRVREVIADPELDYYTLDHRGVGGSALLACPQQQATDSEDGREITEQEWPACMASLRANRQDLDALTTTQSAHDLGALVNRLARPQDQVVVFGASYGTYWANRYLQLYPDQPDGVILDGIVPVDWTFAEFDADLDLLAQRLMSRCAEDPACAAHLGPDPWVTTRQLPDRFDAGHCSDLQIDSRTVRLILGNMLMGGPEVWPYVAPMVHRLNQCRLRDLLAIGTLVERLFEQGDAGQEPASHSPVLQRHVALSEMWPDPPPDPQELASPGFPMTTEVSAAFARTFADWPRYPREARLLTAAEYDGPMLLLHGELDPTIPPERLASTRSHFAGKHQVFVLIPDAGHVVVSDSDCAQSLYRAFLEDPHQPLDTRCVGTDAPTDLFAVPAGQDSAFGTDDLWGDHLSDFEIVLIGAAAAVLLGLVLLIRWLLNKRRRRQQVT